jgi:hypothetical protein
MARNSSFIFCLLLLLCFDIVRLMGQEHPGHLEYEVFTKEPPDQELQFVDSFHESRLNFNNFTGGCSTHCKREDENLDCWMNTLHYYEKILLGIMRRYVTIQINRAIWDANNDHSTDYEWRRKESIRRMSLLPQPKNLDANKAIGERVLRQVITPLMQNAKDEATDIIYRSKKPPKSLHCPRACERHWDPFMWLFLGSCAVTVILCSIMVAMVWYLDKREQHVIENESHKFDVNAKVMVFENPLQTESEPDLNVSSLSNDNRGVQIDHVHRRATMHSTTSNSLDKN